jgi:hypothetical protein
MSQNSHHHRPDVRVPADLKTPVRNHYYFGKLLDVYHLELEQQYVNSKRWLLNRLVTGPGVVCGLDVELTDDNQSVVVMPGVAIDRCGREIVVPKPAMPVRLPPMPDYEPETSKEYRPMHQKKHEPAYYCEIPYAHVVLCYHECLSDPGPAMAGDCETVAICANGSVREQYMVEVRRGFAPERRSAFPDVIEGKRISYNAIIDYVTRPCRGLPEDCCVPLANIELRDTGKEWDPEINIYIRPIVYNNRLLYDLLQSLVRTDYDEGE